MIYDEEKQQILTFEKLAAVNVWHFCLIHSSIILFLSLHFNFNEVSN